VLEDVEQKVVRPRQMCVGAGAREYVPLAKRD